METKDLYFESIPSTNAYLKEHWAEFGPFSFVRSGVQTEGKGRYSRTWISEPNKNLLFSFSLQNPAILKESGLISLGVAVTISRFLEGLGIENVSIKWPNDIYVNGKKICGILLEGRLPDYVIVGIGLNVNQRNFPGKYRHNPTSLALEAGHDFVLDVLYEELKSHLVSLFVSRRLEKDNLILYYDCHDYLRGKKVNFEINNQTIYGTVVGVNDDYCLIAENENGRISVSSEVSVGQSPFSKEND